MQFTTIILLLCISSICVAYDCQFQDTFATDAFAYEQLLPDMVSTLPDAKICGYYNSGEEMDFGNKLTPNGTQKKPVILYPFRHNRFYSLMMINPDPDKSDYNVTEKYVFFHWMLLNLETDEFDIAQRVFDYMGPLPPYGDGPHRYVIFVYTQPWKIKFERMPNIDGNTIEGRNVTMSSYHRFLKRYRYRAPLYGNYFYAEFDESVPERRKRLGLNETDYIKSYSFFIPPKVVL